MAEYTWILEGDVTITPSDPYVRMIELNHPDLADKDFDMLQITQDGSLLLRHPGVPEAVVDMATAFTNSASSLAANFGGGHTATQGNALCVGVLVDQSAGSRTIVQQANWNNIGSVLLAGNNRLHCFTKIATGGEVGSGTWQISGGTSEIAIILLELPGFNGGFVIDEDEADSGTGTTASLVDATSTLERNAMMLGFVGSRTEAHSAPAPTNSYAELATITTTSMRLTAYNKIVDVTGVLDFNVTLDSSVEWLIKSFALTPSYDMLHIDNIWQSVLLRNLQLPRLDEDPIAPPDNHSFIYVKWQPGFSTKSRVLVMHEDGDIYQLPFVREDGPTWQEGTGSPEGVVTAPVGSEYTNISGGAATTKYVKESGTGNTGWVGK